MNTKQQAKESQAVYDFLSVCQFLSEADGAVKLDQQQARRICAVLPSLLERAHLYDKVRTVDANRFMTIQERCFNGARFDDVIKEIEL
jgi:hypothetical protein